MSDSAFFSENHVLYGCLASQTGLGAVGFSRLLEAFGSPEAIYGASSGDLGAAHPHLSDAVLKEIARGPRRAEWDALVTRCRAARITLTAPGWPGYPEPLLGPDPPPPLLFIQGSWRAEDAEAVALVGTRSPTAYGREAAFSLARDLAGAGYAVVSGLAVGIDGAAHAGALSVTARAGALSVTGQAGAIASKDGRTLAVIGCGLDIDYPRENLDLRARIEERGAVISSFPPGTEPRAAYFPQRNRLISGLARATVVVEAGTKSGALITADHARRQGKALFAVPGPIFSPASLGTNALLRAGALPATSAADVLEGLAIPGEARPVLRPAPRPRPAAQARRPAPPKPPEVSSDPVLRLWGADAVCAMDALTERAARQNLAPAALLERLLQLELRGLVRRLPGPAYRRT